MMAHKKQRTLMQHIPSDIINDILLGLPVKSLVRFRYVCKSWNYLITSPRFISMHLHHATKDSYGNHNKVILSSHNFFQSFHCEASTANVELLDFPLEARDGLEVVGSCNGLLCIAINKRGAVLWNPSIRKYKEIPLPLSPIKFSFMYGFGYNSAIDDYKVIICNDGKIYDIQVGIYRLKSNSWTTVGSGHDFSPIQFAGTLVNGALYWFVIHDYRKKIFRFDLRDDTCILIQLPRGSDTSIKLGDFGGSLCMFDGDGTYSIKMWTLKESNYERSWIKLMTISLWEEMSSSEIMVPVCCTKNGEILLIVGEVNEILLKFGEGMKKFYLYTPKEKRKFRELEKCRIHCPYSQAVTYIESLVSPNRNGVQEKFCSFGGREQEKSNAGISEYCESI